MTKLKRQENSHIGPVVLKFCCERFGSEDRTFRADELHAEVLRATGLGTPEGSDRALRMLRERKVIDYVVLERRWPSLYQITRVASEKEIGVIMHFDYGALDAETRAFVLERAEKIKGLKRMTLAAIVQTGEHLTEVKAQLKHGQFLEWIEKEFTWDRKSAERFMSVCEKFKMDNLSNLDIDPSAAYLIAAPSTPEPVRAEAVRRAETGEPVSQAGARALVVHFAKAGALPTAEVSLSELAARERPQQGPQHAKGRAAANVTTCQCHGFHRGLLAEVARRRTEASAKREGRWYPDNCAKTDLVQILNWIEDELRTFNQHGPSVKAREKAKSKPSPSLDGQENKPNGQEAQV